jgi:hypothetical protein
VLAGYLLIQRQDAVLISHSFSAMAFAHIGLQRRQLINLRGKVIPITSMRKRFGLMELEHSSQTRVIIMDSAVSYWDSQLMP